jgi:hypothetical protein
MPTPLMTVADVLCRIQHDELAQRPHFLSVVE